MKLTDINDILVAFAWAHDKEIHNAEMLPEFLGLDVTLGVNKECRELLLVAGIDGHKKHLLHLDVSCHLSNNQLIQHGS